MSRRTADFGVNRQAATRAKRLGKFYGSSGAAMDVPIGSRFSADSVNYIVRERLEAALLFLKVKQREQLAISSLAICCLSIILARLLVQS